MIPLFDGSKWDPLAHWIKIRTHNHNQNFMGIFLGMTGGGKSWSAVSLGESLDKRFNIDNVAYSAKEMVEILVDKRLPKGTPVILDEAGVNYSSRNWMKRENKALGELFQTFRWMNVALLFTLPNFTFLDTQQRRLSHFTFENPVIYRSYKLCFFKGKYLHHDDFSDKYKAIYPLIRFPDGKLAKASRMAFRLASVDLLKEYEKRKFEWNQKMLQRTKDIIVHKLNPDEEKKLKKLKNEDKWILKWELDGVDLKIANKIQANIDDYIVYRGKAKGHMFNNTAIRADFRCNATKATRISRFLLRKPEIKEYIARLNDKEVRKVKQNEFEL